jgi:hypothetical protein
VSAKEQEISMTGKKTLIALYAAVALGIIGAASVAQANEPRDEYGGSVMPGSMVGVNPVYHPGWFGKGAAANTAGNAYGYAPVTIHKHRPVHQKTESN